jgi:capsular polysaccharide biosynthesis protein
MPPEPVLSDVFVNQEGLIFSGGRIRPQSFVAPMYAAYYQRPRGYASFLIRNYVLRRTSSITSGLWVIDNFSPASYHHWVIDCLARLVVGESIYPQERILLLPGTYQRDPFVQFTLRAFPRIHVTWIQPNVKLRVERLAFVPNTSIASRRPPVYRPEPIAEVATRVAALTQSTGDRRRVYLSRAGAARRRAVNERDVVQLLRSHGFDIVVPDATRPAEQVQICRQADVIAGVHGAALTNLIFMRAGGTVVEFRRHEQGDIFFFDHYRALTEALGLRYIAQLCEMTGSPQGYAINDADLVIDLDILREHLSALPG